MPPAPKPGLDVILGRLAASREDKEAWTLLYDQMWPLIFATTFRILRGHQDRAEDSSQDTFVRLIRYCDFRKLREPFDFRRYARTVAENVAYDYLQEMQRVASGSKEYEDALQDRVFDSPEQAALLRQVIQQIWDQLDAEERTLASFVAEGYPISEIAQRLGLSYSNAGVRIHRLRQRIRKYLEKQEIS